MIRLPCCLLTLSLCLQLALYEILALKVALYNGSVVSELSSVSLVHSQLVELGYQVVPYFDHPDFAVEDAKVRFSAPRMR